MLQTALERSDHLAVHATSEAPGEYDRFRPDRYPHGGLVLRAIARDLPREVDTRIDDWRKIAWNLDYAWFTREEALRLFPTPPFRAQPPRLRLNWCVVLGASTCATSCVANQRRGRPMRCTTLPYRPS